MYIGKRKEKSNHKYKRGNKEFIRGSTKTLLIFTCDLCGREFERAKGICWSRDTNDIKHFCSDCSSPSISGAIGREKKSKIWMSKVGEKQIDSCGYMTVYMANTHPYSSGYCGRMREHIIVMENHLGRTLQKGEVVHHIDGNKINNDINNLDLCSVVEHNNCHAHLEWIVFELYKRGVVGYNKETKHYFLKEEMQ